MKYLMLLCCLLFAVPVFSIEKFGRSESVDTGENPATVWDGINLGADDQYPENVTTMPAWDAPAVTLYASSDAAGDTQRIEVQGIDDAGMAVTVRATLAGLTFTQIGTASNWRRVFRVRNVSGSNFAGDIYIHADSADAAVADGIPDDIPGDTWAVVNSVNASNQTLMAFWTVPVDQPHRLEQWCWSINRATAAAEKEANFELQESNHGVWRTIHTFGANNQGGGMNCYKFPNPIAIAGRTDIRVRANVLVSATDIAATFSTSQIPSSVPSIFFGPQGQ